MFLIKTETLLNRLQIGVSRPQANPARQRVGNISFAGNGSASNAMTKAAIEEAHRAVLEIK